MCVSIEEYVPMVEDGIVLSRYVSEYSDAERWRGLGMTRNIGQALGSKDKKIAMYLGTNWVNVIPFRLGSAISKDIWRKFLQTVTPHMVPRGKSPKARCASIRRLFPVDSREVPRKRD